MTNQAPKGNVEVPPSRSWVLWLACAAVGLATLLTAAWYFLHWDYACFQYQAMRYRLSPNDGDMYEMSKYAKDHYREMSEGQIIALLGKPYVVRVDDYRDDSWIHISERLSELGFQPDGSQYALWYGERGPPDHLPGDETSNIWFVIYKDKVVDYGELLP